MVKVRPSSAGEEDMAVMRYERATEDVGRRANTDFGVEPWRYVFVDSIWAGPLEDEGPWMAVLWRALWWTLRARILAVGARVRRWRRWACWKREPILCCCVVD